MTSNNGTKMKSNKEDISILRGIIADVVINKYQRCDRECGNCPEMSRRCCPYRYERDKRECKYLDRLNRKKA